MPRILPPLPPPTIGGSLVIFSPLQWARIWQAFGILHDGLESLLQVAGPTTAALENIMSQNDRLSEAASTIAANLGTLGTQITDLGGKVSTEIADLAAAISSNDPTERERVIQSLTNSANAISNLGAQVQSQANSLDSDDPVVPPVTDPPTV